MGEQPGADSHILTQALLKLALTLHMSSQPMALFCWPSYKKNCWTSVRKERLAGLFDAVPLLCLLANLEA